MMRKQNSDQEASTSPENRIQDLLIKIETLESQLAKEKSRSDETVQKLRSAAFFPEENPNPVLRISKLGAILYANRASAEILATWGCKPGELAPESVISIIQKTLQSDQQLDLVIYTNGKFYSLLVTPISKQEYANLYGREITLQKQEEDRLRYQASILEAINDAIVVTDTAFRITYWNQAAERIYGWTTEEVLGKLAKDVLRSRMTEEQRSSVYAELRSGNPSTTELVQMTKDDRELIIGGYTIPLKDSQGNITGYVAVNQDITERRRMESALKGANELLEQKVQERTVDLQHALESLGVAEEELKVQNDELTDLNLQLSINEQEFRRANALLEKVFESVDMMIAYMDRDFNFLRVNQMYAHADRHDPEYYVGKNHFDLFPNEENQAIFQRVVDTGKPYTVFEKPFEYQYALERGISYWDWSLQPVKDLDGEVQGLVLSLVDVTERVRADQAYHKGLERGVIMAEFSNAIAQVGPDYQATLDTITRKLGELLKASCAIRLVAEDRQVLELAGFYHNQPETQEAFAQIISSYPQPVGEGFAGQVYQSGEGMLIPFIDRIQVRQTFSPAYADYMEKLDINSAIGLPLRLHNQVIGVLIAYRCEPGNAFTNWELEIMQPAADRAALAIKNASLYRDLHKALELEQNMRIQLVQSEKYAALARLVASVAHELNNPIQTIKNCLYIIQTNLSKDDPNYGFIEMAVSEGSRVANLVSQLRETYRPVKDSTAKCFDLVELLEKYKILISPHLQQSHVELEMHCTMNSCPLNGIADQIKQVLINIGLNAVEAMQPDGGVLTIELKNASGENFVQVRFTDTGPGIDSKNLSQLFEPFYTTKPKGTGLGLSICYEIIQAHGGKITAENAPGKGATFIIWLPVNQQNWNGQE